MTCMGHGVFLFKSSHFKVINHMTAFKDLAVDRYKDRLRQFPVIIQECVYNTANDDVLTGGAHAANEIAESVVEIQVQAGAIVFLGKE